MPPLSRLWHPLSTSVTGKPDGWPKYPHGSATAIGSPVTENPALAGRVKFRREDPERGSVSAALGDR
jgi:hypothetical protein